MSTLPLRRLLPVADWPGIDRSLWEAAMGGPYVATLNPVTIPLVAEGYGRWISALASEGRLDAGLHPADRVTPASVQAYIDVLREAGNNKPTIVARLGQLAAALRIMEPRRSFTWLHPSKLLREGDRQTRPTEDDGYQLRGWPAIDLRLWQAGLEADDILAKPRHASGLRPETIHTILVGYRRWLVFLRTQGRLDPTIPPGARVTRENVVDYLRVLQDCHCNASIIARLSELRSAMLIMHPDADFRWLTSPGGRSLAALLPISRKPIQAFDSKVLYEWGRTMMQDALVEAHPEHRRLAYRNGLLIALFAARAPRVRSMASLSLGRTVVRNGGTYRLVFEKEDVKTSRSIEYDTPAGLTSAIDRYIAVERAELLAGQRHDAFWLNKYGEPLSADNISDMIQRQSKRHFGIAFGPHRFRHALGTTAPLTDPAHPGVAAAILGISGHMVEKHYNLASQADVACRFHTNLRKERAGLQSLARSAFRQRQR